MRTFLRKITNVKKRQVIKKVIVSVIAVYSYGPITTSADLFITSRQETQSTNSQKIETV